MDALRLALYGQRAKCSTRGNLSYSDFLRQSRYRHCQPQEPSRVELLIEEIIEGQPKQYRICRTWDDTLKNNRDHLSPGRNTFRRVSRTRTDFFFCLCNGRGLEIFITIATMGLSI